MYTINKEMHLRYHRAQDGRQKSGGIQNGSKSISFLNLGGFGRLRKSYSNRLLENNPGTQWGQISAKFKNKKG